MSDPRRDLLPLHEAQHSFDVVLRGYDRSQVADTIERLEADFRIALADRDAAAARSADLASQLSALHGEIEQLRRKAATANAPTFENISERIQHMLQLAEEEAAEIRRAAEPDAMAVREQTAAEERALLERHAAGQAEVERMLAEARQTAEQIAQKAQIRADELVAKAQERVARLDAESQARRAKVEEDFDIAQRARRAEAARAEEERERVSTQAARQRVSAAEQHATALVAEAEAKAEAIRDVRDELTGRLVQARQLLDSLPDLGDRPQQSAAMPAASQPAPSAPAPATAREPERRPQPAPQTPAQNTAPAAAQPQPGVAVDVGGRPRDERGGRRPPAHPDGDAGPGPHRRRAGRRRGGADHPPAADAPAARHEPGAHCTAAGPGAADPGDRPGLRPGSFLNPSHGTPARAPLDRTVRTARGLLAVLVCLTSCVLAGMLGTGRAAAADDGALLRIAHLSPDTPAVDVALAPLPGGGAPLDDPGPAIATGLSYGDLSQYRDLAPGSYALSVRRADSSPRTPPALSLRIDLPPGNARTVALSGSFADLSPTVLTDDLSAPAPGTARVRVLAAAAGAPTVDLTLPGGGAPARALPFGETGPWTAVPAGPSTARLGNGSGAPAELPLDLRAGSVDSLLVLDDADGGLTLRVVVDAAGPAAVPARPVAAGGGGTAGTTSRLPAAALAGAGALLLAGLRGRRRVVLPLVAALGAVTVPAQAAPPPARQAPPPVVAAGAARRALLPCGSGCRRRASTPPSPGSGWTATAPSSRPATRPRRAGSGRARFPASTGRRSWPGTSTAPGVRRSSSGCVTCEPAIPRWSPGPTAAPCGSPSPVSPATPRRRSRRPRSMARHRPPSCG